MEWWLEQPYRFALYCLRHLRELDHRRSFIERVNRHSLASLISHAFHEPPQLERERHMMLASVSENAALSNDHFIAIGRRMAAEMDAGRVMSEDALVGSTDG